MKINLDMQKYLNKGEKIDISFDNKTNSNSIIEMLIMEDILNEQKIFSRFKSNVYSYMVNIMPFKDAVTPLKDAIAKFKGSDTLYITDPYILSKAKIGSYIKELYKILTKVPFKKIYLLTPCDDAHYNADNHKELENMLAKADCELKVIDNNDFHDRFWLAPDKGAFSVGTSVSGMGKRICRITPLDDDDYNVLLDMIKKICK